MFKHIILTLSFAAALGAAGFYLSDTAKAQWYGWNRPYAYYGPQTYYAPRYYAYDVPYRSSYYRGYYPYRAYTYSYYDDPGYYYYRPAPRVAVQIGPVWR